ncbi:MAG: hypothetical protein CMK92_02375 [Pseudomonas sp.]|nr:hypothetical protein [Pseudomonas sp.]
MNKWVRLLVGMTLAFLDILIFAMIYNSFDGGWTNSNDELVDIGFAESMWVSINFASVLGSGDFQPVPGAPQTWASIQVYITMAAFIAFGVMTFT